MLGRTTARTLRAQLDPHFLFNALTTIGYLIQTAPERAVDTLLQLTTLPHGRISCAAESAANLTAP